MAAAITEHEIPEDPSNDPDHPIPFLRVIDVAGYRKDGGANLSIVVASPIDGSKHSQTRLLDKIEAYLSFIGSPDYLESAGAPPSPSLTTIEVLLHPDSSEEIRSLLSRCNQWVHSSHASLVVRDLTADELGST
jgi:hypothetical protein